MDSSFDSESVDASMHSQRSHQEDPPACWNTQGRGILGELLVDAEFVGDASSYTPC